jgi:hypothetical protein
MLYALRQLARLKVAAELDLGQVDELAPPGFLDALSHAPRVLRRKLRLDRFRQGSGARCHEGERSTYRSPF